MDAFYTFLADDGWAIASHIALSTLMALFPFLIVLTSLAGFFGSKELADQAAGLLLQVWPQQVADALSGEIHDVLTTTRGDILTDRRGARGVFRLQRRRGAAGRAQPRLCGDRAAALVLAAAGIDRLHAGRRLHLAGDGVPDRARSADAGDGAAPHSVLRREQRAASCSIARYGITISALVVALFILHAWLPAGAAAFCRSCPASSSPWWLR